MKWMAAALALGSLACGGEAADPSKAPRDPAVRGPWDTGVTTLVVTDPADAERTFLVEVWYPARTRPGDELDAQLGIETTSVRDAEPDRRGAPFPVVAFSHGNGGIRFQSVYLTEHLASHGYVVVAPDHLYNTLADMDDSRIAEVLRNRPRDVTLALDAFLAESQTGGAFLEGLGDGDRVAVAGHSFGGFTALVVAGAKMDVEALRATCVGQSSLICDGVDDRLTQEVADGFHDARVSAAVSLAPGGRSSFGPSGLSLSPVPVQVQAGGLDTITTLDEETRPIYDGLAAPKVWALLPRAAHFSFTDICPLYELLGGSDGALDFLATEGCGPNTMPVGEAQSASRTLAAAFFERHLRGVADDSGPLTAAGAPEGVEVESVP